MTTTGVGGTYDPDKYLPQQYRSDTDPLASGTAKIKNRQSAVQPNPASRQWDSVNIASVDQPNWFLVTAGNIEFKRSAESHPLYDLALDKFRDVSGGAGIKDAELQSAYQGLLNGLSQSLQDRFNAEMQKTVGERNDPAMEALNQMLEVGAQIIAIVKSFSNPIDEKSPELQELGQLFQSMPELAGNAGKAFAIGVSTAIMNYATSIGPNNPSYSTYMEVASELNSLSNE